MRLLVADDYEIVRRGLRSLLLEQPNFIVCGEAIDGQDAIEKARDLKPDVVVMDVSMPRLNGLEATREIRRTLPDCQVLILSQHESAEMARQALKAGARGYVVKSSVLKDLISALTKLSRGEYFFDPAILDQAPSVHNDIHEILERSAAFEHALRQSEELYRSTFQSAGVGVAHVSPEGRWLRVNRKLCDIVGYSEPELLGLTFQQITHPDDLPSDLVQTEKLLNGTLDMFAMEKRYIRKDGSHVWINLTVSCTRDATGKLDHFISVIEDISARKDAENALRESEQRYRTVTEAAPLMVWMSGTDKLCYYFNKGWLDFVGRSLEQEAGNGWAMNVHPDDLDRCLETYTASFDARLPFEMEYRLRHHTGHYRWIFDRGLPRHAPDGTFEGYVGGCLDIHDRKEAAEKIRLAQETLRLMKIQDEERRKIARELHDSAGQTLTALDLSLAQLMERVRVIAPELVEEGKEIEVIVQQLFREIRTTSYLLHPPLLDEAGLSSALNWYVQGVAERSGIEINLSISRDMGRLPAEMELAIFRMVQECLTNIHRHAESKTASIRVARQEENLRIEVRDEGKGIPIQRLAEIQSRGSGVGIGGIRERLRQFHGEMRIESDGSGTTVLASIPLPDHSHAKDHESVRAAV
jgi:PAS domain S-box-containing protein